MKCVFVSNFMNDHQVAFCDEMSRLLGDGFAFVAQSRMSEDRLSLGWEDANRSRPYIVRAYEDDARKLAAALVQDADVALINPGYTEYVSRRARESKLTFLVTERILKRGTAWRYAPPKAFRTWRWFARYRRNPAVRVLANGAYVGSDLALCGFPAERCYQFGYFPAMNEMGSLEPRKCRGRDANAVPTVLWAGRMIDLKRPMDALLAAQIAHEQGLSFKIDFVGSGPEREALIREAETRNLQGWCRFTVAPSREDVIELMAQADIFLATSDFREGWGAVINEAMATGCATIASSAVGAAPVLIQPAVNGLLYTSGDISGLASALASLIKNPGMRMDLQSRAVDTIQQLWNASVAAERTVQLAQSLLAGGSDRLFTEGPCSPAQVLSPSN